MWEIARVRFSHIFIKKAKVKIISGGKRPYNEVAYGYSVLCQVKSSMTEESDTMPESSIERVIVAVDDILEAFKRNRRDADQQRSHVLKLSPPFTDDCVATLTTSDDYAYYPPEMDPKPVHLDPEAFVSHEDGDGPEHQTDVQIPTYQHSRVIAKEDHGDDVAEEIIDEYHAVSMEIWEGRVRNNLKETVRVARNPTTGEKCWAKIQYRE